MERPAAPRGAPSGAKFGFDDLLQAIRQHAGGARCANDLDREVVLERMRTLFGVEPEVLLRRGFDKAYRHVVEGV